MRSRSMTLFLSIGLVAAACGDDDTDDGGDDDDGPVQETLLDRAAEALGGAAAIQAARSERITAVGTRLDPSEAPSSTETVEIGDFEYSLTHRLAEDRLRVHTTVESDFLVPITMDYTIVIDGDGGSVEGVADLFSGVADPRSLPSAQLTTRLKHTRVTSILALMRRALADPDMVSQEEDAERDGRLHHVLAVESDDHPPLRLFIDPASLLPVAIETTEHTPPLGDTLVAVQLDDYREVGELRLPYQVTIDVDGLAVHAETRSLIEIDPDDPDEGYAVAGPLRAPFVEADGHRGWIGAQYLQGVELLGLPFFYLDPSEIAFDFVELAPGVFHARGGTHNVLVVEMADHLVLVDAPVRESYSQRLHAAMAKRFPDKPVRTVVASHFHYDHVGGIRYFAADCGVTVVAGAPSVPFYQAVFANPYSVEPDRYAGSQEPVTIEGVEGSLELTDGTRTVEVHRIASGHAADMVIVYLPAERILFNADLWSPEQGPLVGYFLVGATELRDETARLELPGETLVVGAHSAGTGTLADLGELVEQETGARPAPPAPQRIW